MTQSPEESPEAVRLPLFPLTARLQTRAGDGGRADAGTAHQELTLDGQSLIDLAAEYGTPLYLFDQVTLDAAVAAYGASLRAHYPGATGITFAAKSLLNLAAAQWAYGRDLLIDCTGAGEIHVAVAAGVPPSHILVHGVNKSDADLDAGLRHAGVIVVDNLWELERLAARYAAQRAADRPVDRPAARSATEKRGPELWLRVRPGLAVDTHAYRQTGQEESKFGLGPAETQEAVALCLHQGLPLTGLHFHQGSHFHDPAPLGPALETVLNQVHTLYSQSGWSPQVLSPGGGWGVAYHEDELPHPSIDAYVAFVGEHLAQGCRARGLPLPRLQVEPGRSLVARAGVALYRVGATKQAGNRIYALLDGGMADNPRPALYGARYSALPVRDPQRAATQATWLAGPFCESGDILIENLPMPPLAAGELVAVPASGAYHLAMGSNYNGARKPAVLWLAQGQAHRIQRRETLDDLIRRDGALPEGVLGDVMPATPPTGPGSRRSRPGPPAR